jgi:transcriptional regulator with XRE-family HTH domain
MEYREISQTELAGRIGLTQSAISNLVTDSARKPSAPTLLKLADALGCQPSWLLDGYGDPFRGESARPSDVERGMLDWMGQLFVADKNLLLAIAQRLADVKRHSELTPEDIQN